MTRDEARRREQALISHYRALHPRSRAIGIIVYAHNGPVMKQRMCVLCGAMGPTWCARYPKTHTAIVWEESHRNAHVENDK